MSKLIKAKVRVVSRIDDLIPEAREPALKMIALLSDQGIPVRVTFTYRSFATQQALWMQGRRPLEEVNVARAVGGMAPITASENVRRVTNAKPGRSWHNWRRAFDLVPMKGSIPIWNGPWETLGKTGKMLGFGWGGDWKKPDKPHFQWTKGAKLEDLIACYPHGMS